MKKLLNFLLTVLLLAGTQAHGMDWIKKLFGSETEQVKPPEVDLQKSLEELKKEVKKELEDEVFLAEEETVDSGDGWVEFQEKYEKREEAKRKVPVVKKINLEETFEEEKRRKRREELEKLEKELSFNEDPFYKEDTDILKKFSELKEEREKNILKRNEMIEK